MGDIDQAPRVADPEALCTRVTVRVIEELSCVDIAPDSPVWTELQHDGIPVGQLAVYRGRSGVAAMVCARLRRRDPDIDSHMVAVFTDPQSLVPHLVVDAFVVGDEASFHADLLPRLDLGTSVAYLDWCYAPLTEIREALDRDARFTQGHAPLHRQAIMTPWRALYSVAPRHLEAAEGCLQRYVDQWVRLMKQGVPRHVQQETCGVDVALRSARLRKLVFNRDVDPVWEILDRSIGSDNVEVLLAALQG